MAQQLPRIFDAFLLEPMRKRVVRHWRNIESSLFFEVQQHTRGGIGKITRRMKGLHTYDYRLILKSDPEVLVLAVSNDLSALQTASHQLQRVAHFAMHHEEIDVSFLTKIPRAIAQAVLHEVRRRSAQIASCNQTKNLCKLPDGLWHETFSYLIPRPLPLRHSQVKRVFNMDTGDRKVPFQGIKNMLLKSCSKAAALYGDKSPKVVVTDATGHTLNDARPGAAKGKLRVVITFQAQRQIANSIIDQLHQCSSSLHHFTQLACVCSRFYNVSRRSTLWFPIVKGVDLNFMTSASSTDPELRNAVNALAEQAPNVKEMLQRQIALSLGTYSDNSRFGFQPEHSTYVYDLCAARTALAHQRLLSDAEKAQATKQERYPRFHNGMYARREEVRQAFVDSGAACVTTIGFGAECTSAVTGLAAGAAGAVALGAPAAAVGALGSCIAGKSRKDMFSTAGYAAVGCGCVVGGVGYVAGGVVGVAGGAACGVAASAVRMTEGASVGIGGLAGNLADSLRRCPDEVFGGWGDPQLYSSGIHCHHRGLIWGLAKGVKSFSKECTGAVIGLVREPVTGAKKDGALGACKGMGRALVGLVAKPTAGMLDITGGVLRGAGNRLRHVRNFTLIQELRGELIDVRSKLRGKVSRISRTERDRGLHARLVLARRNRRRSQIQLASECTP